MSANGSPATSTAPAQRPPLANASAAPQTQSNGSQNASSPPAAATGAPPAANGSSTTPGLVYPALHLLPLNDTFVPKQISLSPPGTRIKIGRQTNAKTVPSATNGYFDSKVLSRMHAEVWSEDGKIYIKDVKSSNGTFINGDRLSPESAESDAFELHSEDVVEFGIDIVSDDNKTIVHHKVSTKIHLAINAEEAVALMKNLPALYRMHDSALHRRPSKAGLTFDHVFNRLQTELHKSRETGGELGGLTTTMAEIHDTLGGGVPPPLPTFPQPTRGAHYNHLTSKGAADPQTLALLQAQLTDTQASLAGHADKVRSLESLLVEHESMKNEVNVLRDAVQSTRRDMDHFRTPSSGGMNGISSAHESEDNDFDDAASVSSVGTIRPRQGANSLAPEDGTLREQNAALLQRLDELTRELREASSLSQSLMAQQEAAANAVQALEGRVAQLEQDVEEGNGRLEAWKKQYETDFHRDQNERAADRQRLQAAVEQWESTGVLDSDVIAVDSGGSEGSTKRSTPARSAGRRRSRSREKGTAATGVQSPSSGASKLIAELEGSSSSSRSAIEASNDPDARSSTRPIGGNARNAASLPLNITREARESHARPPEYRKKAGSSIPIAGSIGMLAAVGVAVWIMANRD